MNTLPGLMRTFAELFCEQHHVAPSNFVRAIFWRCLHRRALPFAPFVVLLHSRYFIVDYDLVSNVGALTCMSYLDEEIDDFHADTRNRGFVRRRLKIRISGRRLCHVAHSVLGDTRFPPVTPVAGEAASPKIPRSI